jgi:hypothetical protein
MERKRSELKNPSTRDDRVLDGAAIILVTIFVIGWIFGAYGPTLMSNQKCFVVLGCNIGFFGYDAALHFLSGIMDATLIVWLMRKFPTINMFHDRFWKNFLVIITLVAFIAVSWEFGELCRDQFRMKILHENLTIPINRLTQPTNNDTMGDITFSILGAVIAISVLKPLIRKAKDATSSGPKS